MSKYLLSIFLALLLTQNTIFSYAGNPTIKEPGSDTGSYSISKTDNTGKTPDEPQKNVLPHKKGINYELYQTVLGLSYFSAMTGCLLGFIGGLCWAFSSKNKIACMATCLTGCGLFIVGATTGLIVSNVYVKYGTSDNVNALFNKYELVLKVDFINNDYMLGVSYKL